MTAACACETQMPPLIKAGELPEGKLGLRCTCGQLWIQDPKRAHLKATEMVCRYCGRYWTKGGDVIGTERGTCPNNAGEPHLWGFPPSLEQAN